MYQWPLCSNHDFLSGEVIFQCLDASVGVAEGQPQAIRIVVAVSTKSRKGRDDAAGTRECRSPLVDAATKTSKAPTCPFKNLNNEFETTDSCCFFFSFGLLATILSGHSASSSGPRGHLAWPSYLRLDKIYGPGLLGVRSRF